MKLLTFDAGDGSCAGVLCGESVVPVHELLGMQRIADIGRLLELGPDVLARLREALSSPAERAGVPLSGVQLCPPVLRPPTVRDFMVYEGHASMGGKWQLPDEWYRMPVFYFSNPLCLFGSGASVPMPVATGKFDFELEIAAVVGRGGSNIAVNDAMSHIAGFTIMNDWSSRDLQREEMRVGLGPAKGKDSATSMGPWIVTVDELAPMLSGAQLHARCTLSVNGVEWVSGVADGMQHDWAAIIAHASRDSRIVPGDVIGAGTITGGSVAEAKRLERPARYLQAGDRIEIEVEGLGTLRNVLSEVRS